MLKKMLLASQNKHKINEFRNILADIDVKLLSLDDLKDDETIEETGKDFEENAMLKACHFAKKHQLMTLADDSGLIVEALDGRPGIHSARYSGFGDEENLQKVLEEMKEKENRDASFVATIVICQPDGQTRTFEGQVFGFIGFEKKGERGFGYDPIFYPVNHSITFAEMDETSKNRISHRGIALSKFKEALNEIIDNQ